MSDDDDKVVRLRAVLNQATPSKPMNSAPARSSARSSSTSIRGNNNVVVNGDGANIGALPRPRVTVKSLPGVEHITSPQLAELKDLVAEIVRESEAMKKSPTTYQREWTSLNSAMKASSAGLILLDDFDAAKAFLMRRRAMLRAKPSAKTKIPGWRASAIGAIHARCRNHEGGEARRKLYMLKKFGTDTMTECSDEQIETLRKHVFGW